jgi:formamidopyrimidine-DNA glycosylase
MPELPEVETTKKGIQPHLDGQTIKQVTIRNPKLRVPVPLELDDLCAGKKIKAVTRRAKYLLLHLTHGYILIHLGMSGHLRIVSKETLPEKHDHVDVLLGNDLILRYCDPRRFGLFFYIDENPYQHSLLCHLGPEPLSEDFNSNYLSQRAKNKNLPIKSLIMNNDVVVGVGNIYATESLFLAGIHPLTAAKNVSTDSLNVLTNHIKQVLQAAIEAGGTTLKDFYSFEGKPGYFSIALKVYGRKKQPCFQCDSIVDTVVIGGRHSAFCPHCQPLR